VRYRTDRGTGRADDGLFAEEATMMDGGMSMIGSMGGYDRILFWSVPAFAVIALLALFARREGD
jgi:hypothetical protein